MKEVIADAIRFVERTVLPSLSREPGLGNQITDYDFLLEFSGRRRANPIPLIERAVRKAAKIRIFAYVSQCRYHCAYCPFPTSLDGRQEEDALRILSEIARFRESFSSMPSVESLSVGGGTPTILAADAIWRFVTGIRDNLSIPRGTYANLECSPDTLTPEKIAASREAGITRMSLGVQTFNDSVLNNCGRRHNGVQAMEACHMLVNQGFGDVNVDLMRGLPGQTLEVLATDVQRLIQARVPSVHLYRLRLPRNHPIVKKHPYTKDYLRDVIAMQLVADRLFCAAGYRRHHSAHWTMNTAMRAISSHPWDFGKTEIAFGPGAYSYFPFGECRNEIRKQNWRQALDNRIPSLKEGSLYSTTEQETRWVKFCLKGLTLFPSEFQVRFAYPIEQSALWPKLRRLLELGILASDGSTLTFTELGYAVAEEAIRFVL